MGIVIRSFSVKDFDIAALQLFNYAKRMHSAQARLLHLFENEFQGSLSLEKVDQE